MYYLYMRFSSEVPVDGVSIHNLNLTYGSEFCRRKPSVRTKFHIVIASMDITTVTDPDGSELRLGQHGGDLFPPYPGIGKRIVEIKTLKCRDDDTFILAFPKSGTHWTWEILQLLSRSKTENMVGEKMQDFLEKCGKEQLDLISSPRMLNTHVRPDRLPEDLVNRKCKIIYIQRNPKDVMVSHYNHCVNISAVYGYSGKFSGFFELALSGQVDYGRWFEYSLEYENFFRNHPDIPVLRLQYEDMKQDLLSNVRRISEFCAYPVSQQTMVDIAAACEFENMKKFKTENVDPSRALRWKDGKYNMYRKGVVGDWKNHFTVAQNERFEAEARRVLGYERSSLLANWE